MDKMNDRGMVGIDLMVAIMLVLAAIMFAILTMPSLSHEDRDWRIKQYMTATRATDNLVQDDGEPGWDNYWKTKVTKIGLLYVDDNDVPMMKVLNLTKVQNFMGPGYEDTNTSTLWWEYPNSTENMARRMNVSKSLGLEGYNYYIQLHPVDLILTATTNSEHRFNSTKLENNLSAQKGINFDTVTVIDRYVYIWNLSDPKEIKYLKYINGSESFTIHYRLNMWVW